jgi:hypothetical protein
MNNIKLAEMIKSLRKAALKEQATYAKQQWEKEKKPKIDIGGHAHDPSGPNKAHLEEEDLDETMGTATPLGGRHNPREHIAKKGLAGKRLQRRVSLQRSGNQRRSPGIYEESKDKKKEKMTGKTDTGKGSEVVDLQPQKPELTTYN